MFFFEMSKFLYALNYVLCFLLFSLLFKSDRICAHKRIVDKGFCQSPA